jgi:hypothetical protein
VPHASTAFEQDTDLHAQDGHPTESYSTVVELFPAYFGFCTLLDKAKLDSALLGW